MFSVESIRQKIKAHAKTLKIIGAVGTGIVCVACEVYATCGHIAGVVNTRVLFRERSHAPEYIYVDGAGAEYAAEWGRQDDAPKQSRLRHYLSSMNIFKELKQTVTSRLLWLSRHGTRAQRDLALQQLAIIKNIKEWDFAKLAQSMDPETAVLLARTEGADPRFFLPAPLHVRRAAKSRDLVSAKLYEVLMAVKKDHAHPCIDYFINKYYGNLQEETVDSQEVPSKPSAPNERQLCLSALDALHHHLTVYSDVDSLREVNKQIVSCGGLSHLAELLLRHRSDPELELAVLRVLGEMSSPELRADMHQNGLIRDLCRWIKHADIRYCCGAAVCLANISGEERYSSGLFVLQPLYRRAPARADVVAIHGLRGGVFVTWRQRDNCPTPVGLLGKKRRRHRYERFVNTNRDRDRTNSMFPKEDLRCGGFSSVPPPDAKAPDMHDPDWTQATEEAEAMEEELLLQDMEVVMNDIPERSRREPQDCHHSYLSRWKRKTLHQEEEDRNSYTACWPKDWLPGDCPNLRVVGVNYFTTVSEWLGGCSHLQQDLKRRATRLADSLARAHVGDKDRPVIWLAHSMGGLIIKQLLVDSDESESEAERQLAANTRAIIFYSTPHRGSSLASLGKSTAALFWPSADVQQLQLDAPVLLELQEKFARVCKKHDWVVISFAELKPTLVSSFKVPVQFVEERSADLGIGALYMLPLDHLSICKPATRQSILYRAVVDVVQDVLVKRELSKVSNEVLFMELLLMPWAREGQCCSEAEEREKKKLWFLMKAFDM